MKSSSRMEGLYNMINSSSQLEWIVTINPLKDSKMLGLMFSILSTPTKITVLGRLPLPNLSAITTTSQEEKLSSIFLQLLSTENSRTTTSCYPKPFGIDLLVMADFLGEFLV